MKQEELTAAITVVSGRSFPGRRPASPGLGPVREQVVDQGVLIASVETGRVVGPVFVPGPRHVYRPERVARPIGGDDPVAQALVDQRAEALGGVGTDPCDD